MKTQKTKVHCVSTSFRKSVRASRQELQDHSESESNVARKSCIDRSGKG